jgi:hypothetical protein
MSTGRKGKSGKAAAAPPLNHPGALRARGPGACRAEDTGPLLRPQGRWRAGLRPAALRAALDPGDLGGPCDRKQGQAPACPYPERGTPCGTGSGNGPRVRERPC